MASKSEMKRIKIQSSEPDTLFGMVVVMVGNMSEGYRAIGPFNNWDEAATWADTHNLGGLECWLMKLEGQEGFEI